MEFPTMSNLEFISLGYFLPLIISIIGFRIGIARKWTDPDFGNAFVTFCPIINMIIATMFAFMLIAMIMDYVVNGSYKRKF
jgi:hypothetical protein